MHDAALAARLSSSMAKLCELSAETLPFRCSCDLHLHYLELAAFHMFFAFWEHFELVCTECIRMPICR